ncbi:MAG: amidophosphoribosyltransferase [Promethearchaeota archaeon]
MDKLRESCGVFGVFSSDPDYQVSHLIYDGLLILQHRGQESAGISIYDGKGIGSHRRMGTVNEVFPLRILSNLFGYSGIGHVRYSTSGGSMIDNAQPYSLTLPHTEFSFAFNGTITNYDALKNSLGHKGHYFTTDVDTEVIGHLIATNLLHSGGNYVEAIKETMYVLEGAYSLVLLNSNGQLIAVRDPLGFRPLCIGKLNETLHMISSESVVFDILDTKFMRDVRPGEIVSIDKSGLQSYQVASLNRQAHCMFEYVYFSRPDSVLDGVPVHRVRTRLGEILAKVHPVKADIVVPVPDSGRSAAIGFSQASGIPLCEGLIKNRSIWRTFIMPYPELRKRFVKLKLNPVKTAIEGKRVVLVDDSIVRSTTSRRIVSVLKKVGAREVHLRISCPPLIAPCHMGIDFPSYDELVAANKTVPEICEDIGADSLGYMTVDGLVEAIGLPKSKLCLACLTDKYPTARLQNLVNQEHLAKEAREFEVSETVK